MGIFQKLFGNSRKEPVEPEIEEELQKDTLPVAERYEKVLKELEPYKRIAYVPITKQVKPQFCEASKIGGLPYLNADNPWPICPNCSQHMALFLQINRPELPIDPKPGILQLFYCIGDDKTHCESDLEAWEPFSKGSVVRLVEYSGTSLQEDVESDLVLSEKRILSWDEKADYPHLEESMGLGHEMDDDLYEYMETREGLATEGDKLYGWPYWVQGEEYPNDRETETQMELFFQLDSEVNLDFMFGDCGVGHVTISPDNEKEMAFAWACH